MLHGFPSSSHMFRHLIPGLADRYHVIAADHVGYGQSSMPQAGEFTYTFDHLAAITGGLRQNLLGRSVSVRGITRSNWLHDQTLLDRPRTSMSAFAPARCHCRPSGVSATRSSGRTVRSGYTHGFLGRVTG
ncbi:alpha/beta fold hydrolase [Streptomyces sp. NPDC007162]|uniref:alpha/beta fold hydrolase n=1 Tax=Streptomyces sp. NPDC007162 TaxID=3156917 RepID=UPI0033EB1854